MSKNFKELVAKMPPESQARAEGKAEELKRRIYTWNDRTSGRMSLSEILKLCACGRLLIRRPGGLVLCPQCGSAWAGQGAPRQSAGDGTQKAE